MTSWKKTLYDNIQIRKLIKQADTNTEDIAVLYNRPVASTTPVVVISAKEFVGNNIVLDNIAGNYQTSTANTLASYNVTGEVNGAYARILINTATEPVLTGTDGTPILCNSFIPNTDMYLMVTYNSTKVEYWFERI